MPQRRYWDYDDDNRRSRRYTKYNKKTKVYPTYKQKLVHCFQYFFLNEECSDVIFYVGVWPKSRGPVDKTKLLRVPGHRCIVGMGSDALADLIGDRAEVVFDNIEPLDFLVIMRFLYFRQAKCINQSISILCACRRFELPDLLRTVSACGHGKDKEELFRGMRLFTEIQKYGSSETMSFIRSLFSTHSDFLITEGYKNMDRNAFSYFLGMHLDLSEEEVFGLCLKWAHNELQSQNCDQPTPKQLRETISDLLFNVRLPCLTRKQLEKSVLVSGIFTEEESNLLLELVSREGALKKFGNKFLDRFPLEQRYGSYNSWNLKIREKFCHNLTNTLEQNRTGEFDYDQVKFELSEDAFMLGVTIQIKEEAEQGDLHSVSLVNPEGRSLFYKRDLEIEEEDYEEVDVKFENPLRLLANTRYNLAVTFKQEERRILVEEATSKYIQVQDSSFSIHLDCAARSYFNIIKLKFNALKA